MARGDTVEVAAGRLRRKVKSLQRFREPCTRVSAGDRAGVCLTAVAPAGIERTFVSAPGLLRSAAAAVCLVQRCRFYTGAPTVPSPGHSRRAPTLALTPPVSTHGEVTDVAGVPCGVHRVSGLSCCACGSGRGARAHVTCMLCAARSAVACLCSKRELLRSHVHMTPTSIPACSRAGDIHCG